MENKSSVGHEFVVRILEVSGRREALWGTANAWTFIASIAVGTAFIHYVYANWQPFPALHRKLEIYRQLYLFCVSNNTRTSSYLHFLIIKEEYTFSIFQICLSGYFNEIKLVSSLFFLLLVSLYNKNVFKSSICVHLNQSYIDLTYINFIIEQYY